MSVNPSPLPFVPPSILATIKADLLSLSGLALTAVTVVGQVEGLLHLSNPEAAILGEVVSALGAAGLVLKELAYSGFFGRRA